MTCTDSDQLCTAPGDAIVPEVEQQSNCRERRESTRRRLRWNAQFYSKAEVQICKVREIAQASGLLAETILVEAHLHTEPELDTPTGPITEELLRSLEQNCMKLVPETLRDRAMTYLGKCRISMSIECFQWLEERLSGSGASNDSVYLDLPAAWGVGEVCVARVGLGRRFCWDVCATVAEVDAVIRNTLSKATSRVLMADGVN